MRKIKLLGLLSLFVIPVLGNVSFTVTNEYKSNLATSELKNFNKNNFTDPEPEPEHFFRVGENEYDTFADAISGATDGDTIQVLKDFTASDTPETAADLPLVTINKSLTINGIGDDAISHQIIGQKIDITGSNTTVNFENAIINGNKKYNKDGANDGHYLIYCNGSTLKLNGHTVIKNYKFDSYCMIRLRNGAVLYINDQTEITDCAAKYGLIRYDTNSDTNRPAVYMNGGKIHGNYSSNRGLNVDGYVEGLVFYVFGGATENESAKFYMYDGEICNNTAACWDNLNEIHSVGLIFLHNKWVDIRILGGSIHDNVAKLGGAVCFGYHINGTGYDYKPNGNIEIGGDAYIYDNHGIDNNGELFDSNIYFDRPDVSEKNVIVSKDYPLTKNSKTGILFSDEDLPEPGNQKTAVKQASFKDLGCFVADNKDYTTRYEGDTNHTIAIYKYTERDPRFTEPVFYDDLSYNGQTQQLIYAPGQVSVGGELLYSQDYNGDIGTAHWTNNANEIVGKESGDYNVVYYVKADDGYDDTPVFDRMIRISKGVMEIIWPEDDFIYDGTDQIAKLTPYYVKEGGNVNLRIQQLKLEDGTAPSDGFLKVTTAPNNRYVVTAIKPEEEEDLLFPEDHSKFYTMRISEEQYIEEGGFVIETDEKTGKPVVKVESDIGYDAWTTLFANNVKQEDKHYKDSVQILKDNKAIGNNDAVSTIYDIKMTDKEEGTEVNPDGTLKLSLAIPKELGNSHNLSVYQIVDGKPTKLDCTFTDDGYVTVSASKLGTFVIVHNLKSLLWLIITLSIVGAALIGASAYVIVKEKQKKTKEGTNNE